MKLIKYICTIVLVSIQLVTIAQEDDYARTPKESKDNTAPKQKSDFWDKIYVGGGLGAQFGSVTVIDVSPLVGYRFTDRFSAGIGLNYQYYSIKVNNDKFSTSIYGGRTFARFNVFDFLFLHSELEMLNWECPRYEPTGFVTDRLWVPGLLVGGGLFQPFGNSSSGIFIMGLYNILYDDCTPYNSPLVLRLGVTFGL